MASVAKFFENLWESVFVPGTTPTLLIATNVTFAALQVVLAILLFVSYSIHFVVLSVLCASLWWSINWFAVELRKAEAAEEEAKHLRRRASGLKDEDLAADDSSDIGEDSMQDEDETETEVENKKKPQKIRVRGGPAKIQGVIDSAVRARAARDKAAEASKDDSTTTGVEVRGGPAKFQQYSFPEDNDSSQEQKSMKTGKSTSGLKPAGDQVESGSVSTDSEWEKVSDR